MVVQTVSSVAEHESAKEQDMYSSIHESEEYFKCGLCWNIPSDTIFFSCSHIFCNICLQNLATVPEHYQDILCPVCGVVNKMTQGETDNQTVNDEPSALDKNLNDRKCELCEESQKAEAKCLECKALMCNFCLQSHKRSKVSKQHDITMLGESHSELSYTEKGNCILHNEELAYFCRPCDSVVCKLCRTNEHRGHRTRPIKAIIGDRKKQLEEKIDDVKLGYICTLEKRLARLPKLTHDFKTDVERVVHDITLRADAIKDQIDSVKMEMIQDVQSKAALGLDRLEQLKRDLEKELLTVGELLKRTHDTVKHGSDIEIVSTSKTSLKLLENLKADRLQPTIHRVDIEFESGELCLNTIKNGFGHCSTRNTGITWSRSVSLCHGSPQDVNVRLISEFHCSVDEYDDDVVNESVQSMTSTSDGQIAICCGCDSDQVVISDSTGLVTNNIRAGVQIDDLVSRDDQSVVMSCFRDRSIRVIEENGNIRELVSTQYYPRGIAATRDGCLLVCVMDKYSTSVTKDSRRMVVKLDSNGTQTHVYEYTNDEKRLFTRPYRVVENMNGDICVTDKTSMGSGRVVVLDNTGNLKFVYDGKLVSAGGNPFSPSGIVCDHFGRLLIADTNNHCIHIVDNCGQFVSFLLKKEDGIKSPTSLVLDSDGRLWIGNENGQVKTYQYL